MSDSTFEIAAKHEKRLQHVPIPRVTKACDAAEQTTRILPETIKAFPKTRYYGSKRKLLPWIYDCIGGLEFETVLDAFGGTGSVSLLLKSIGKEVTYHDGFKFNEDVGRTILSNEVALTRREVVSFIDNIRPTSHTISKLFAGVYYTPSENLWLDGFALQLNNTKLSRAAVALLRYLVYQACLKKRPFNLFHRANLHLRTSRNVSRSFGNHATWKRSFRYHMLEAYDELSQHPGSRRSFKILPSGNAATLEAGYDLVYLDPPYLSLEQRYNRDDYWRRYHFLEGLAQYQKWHERIDPFSNIRLLRQPRWMAGWSDKARYSELLFSMIEKHKKSIVVLSYVANAHPDEAHITEFFARTFDSVVVHSREHSHALGSTPRSELLFIGQP